MAGATVTPPAPAAKSVFPIAPARNTWNFPQTTVCSWDYSPALLSKPHRACFQAMRQCAILFFALTLGTHAAEPMAKISVLDNAVLCVRASRMPDNFPAEIRAAETTNHLSGTVLDLRFADTVATNAASYFSRRKSPLVILVNSQTRGAAAALAVQLRTETAAMIIGNTNAVGTLAPDLVVAASAEDERKFQDNPFYQTASDSSGALSVTNNLLAFVDHTSEADLVRKRIKDGDDAGDSTTPRAEPAQPVVRDPALARAVDLLKALAALHKSRG
jgi:hypothetical protein